MGIDCERIVDEEGTCCSAVLEGIGGGWGDVGGVGNALIGFYSKRIKVY